MPKWSLAVAGLGLLASSCGGATHTAGRPTVSTIPPISVTPKTSKTSKTDPATGPWAVTAIDPASGALLWGIPATNEFEVFSGMVIDAGVIYGRWAGSAGCSMDSKDTMGLAAIDAATGALLWQTPPLVAGDTVLNQVESSVTNGTFVLSSNDSRGPGISVGPAAVAAPPTSVLVGVDTRTGATRWRVETHLRFGSNLAGSVLVGLQSQPGGVVAMEGIDRSSGKSLWQITVPRPANLSGDPTFDLADVTVTGEEAVLAMTDRGSKDSWIAGFDADNGHQLWKFADAPARIPEYTDSGVVITAVVGGLVGMDAKTGRQLWRRDDLQSPGDRQNMAAGRIALVEQAVGIDIVEMSTGKTLWHSAPGSDVVATRANGIVLFGQPTQLFPGGTFQLFAPPNGRLIGTIPNLPAPLEQVGSGSPMEVGPNGHVYAGRTCPDRN